MKFLIRLAIKYIPIFLSLLIYGFAANNHVRATHTVTHKNCTFYVTPLIIAPHGGMDITVLDLQPGIEYGVTFTSINPPGLPPKRISFVTIPPVNDFTLFTNLDQIFGAISPIQLGGTFQAFVTTSTSALPELEICVPETGVLIEVDASLVPPPVADIKANSSDGPITIPYNTSATISWTGLNSTGCSVSAPILPIPWSGVTGSQNTPNLTGSQTFTLDCVGPTGTDNDTVTINVAFPPTACSPPSQSVLTGVNANLTASGGNGTYSWSAPGGSPPSGSGSSFTTSYSSPGAKTVTATSAGTSANCTVNVTAPAPTVNIKANGLDSTTINYDASANLTWTTTNATSCSVTPGGWTQLNEPAGVSTGNLTSNTSYTLSCSGPGGSATDSVLITVLPPLLPTADIKANGSNGPISVAYNTSATISWNSSNATLCTVIPSGWPGLNGSQPTGPLTNPSYTYVLSCSGPGGSASDAVTINVFVPAPTSCSFTPSAVNPGGQLDITAVGYVSGSFPLSMIGVFGIPTYSLGSLNGASKTVTVPAGASGGQYRLRFEASPGSFVYCTPDPFIVNSPPPSSCSIGKSSVAPGDQITVSASPYGGSSYPIFMQGGFLPPPGSNIGSLNAPSVPVTIPPLTADGLYVIRLDIGGGSLVQCSPDLSISSAPKANCPIFNRYEPKKLTPGSSFDIYLYEPAGGDITKYFLVYHEFYSGFTSFPQSLKALGFGTWAYTLTVSEETEWQVSQDLGGGNIVGCAYGKVFNGVQGPVRSGCGWLIFPGLQGGDPAKGEFVQGPINKCDLATPGGVVTAVLPAILALAGFLTIIIIVISAIQFIISSGNPDAAAAARGRLIFALVGFALIILAFAILEIVDQYFLGNSGV